MLIEVCDAGARTVVDLLVFGALVLVHMSVDEMQTYRCVWLVRALSVESITLGRYEILIM